MEFAAVAHEWTELLRDAAHDAFAKKHKDVILRLAVTLSCAEVCEIVFCCLCIVVEVNEC